MLTDRKGRRGSGIKITKAIRILPVAYRQPNQATSSSLIIKEIPRPFLSQLS